MNEEFVQSGVVSESVQFGGWNSLQPSHQKLLEEFVDENEPWLLI